MNANFYANLLHPLNISALLFNSFLFYLFISSSLNFELLKAVQLFLSLSSTY